MTRKLKQRIKDIKWKIIIEKCYFCKQIIKRSLQPMWQVKEKERDPMNKKKS